MSHINKIAKESDWSMAAANLTSLEFSQLKEVLNMVEIKAPEPPVKKEKPMLALEDKKPDSEEEALEEDTPLKKVEEVSLDSSGFLTLFGTVDKASKAKQMLCQADGTDLQRSFGYSGSSKSLEKEKALKKPAAANAQDEKKSAIKKRLLEKGSQQATTFEQILETRGCLR